MLQFTNQAKAFTSNHSAHRNRVLNHRPMGTGSHFYDTVPYLLLWNLEIKFPPVSWISVAFQVSSLPSWRWSPSKGTSRAGWWARCSMGTCAWGNWWCRGQSWLMRPRTCCWKCWRTWQQVKPSLFHKSSLGINQDGKAEQPHKELF